MRRMRQVLLLTMAGFLVKPVSVSADQECDTADALLEQAKQEQVLEKRAALLQRAAAKCPAPVPYYMLGRTYIRQGRPEAALEALNQAIKTNDPDEAPRQYWLIEGRRAETLFLMGRIADALTLMDLAIANTRPKTPKWMLEVLRRIDQHPDRQMMSARTINRVFMSKRAMFAGKGFHAVPSVDIYVLFDTDEDQPNEQGRRQLWELGKALRELAERHRVLLIGHTDKRGPAEHNQDLSERRAQSVMVWLSRQYPDLTPKLTAAGRGVTDPRYPGDSEEDYRLNRRVEVRLLGN